jgi:hypothetical protein
MATKKITELTSGSLTPPLSGMTTLVYSGETHQQNLVTLRQILVDSGSHNFTGSQTFNGDITVTGSVKQVFGALDNGERDFVKVNNVIINGKPYNIVDFSFQDLPEYGDQYKNALVFEYFNGTDYEYGSELTINGKHINLAIYASGSEDLGRMSIRDNYDGTTFANFYADLIEIGAYSGSTNTGMVVGHENVPYINIVSQKIDINSAVHLTGSIHVSGSVIGDGSQLTNLPTNLTNVSMFLSSSTFNTFTSSYNTTSASFDSRINAATNEQDLSYLATTGSNVFIGDQTITGSVDISGSATLNNDNIVSSNTIEKIETITSASYASITPVSGTLYIIID